MPPSSALKAAELVGRIKSVYCKHFCNYNEITYQPRHYLNVLIGPNGSGKSTIVAAIILGMGGEPQLLDRNASNIADYVKSSKTEAVIRITIYGKQPKNDITFGRTFTINAESQFTINGENLSKKRFLGLVASYNIQVNNLCQFLPQNRVQDFSKMNAQELLRNTMLSACDEKLTSDFEKLKEFRKQQITKINDRDNEKTQLEKKAKELEKLQIDVSQFKERETIAHKLNVFKAQKACIIYNHKNRELHNKKINLNELKTALRNKLDKYENEKRKNSELLTKKKQLSTHILNKEKQYNAAIKSKDQVNTKIDDYKQKLNEIHRTLQMNQEETVKTEKFVTTMQSNADKYKADAAHLSSLKANLKADIDLQKVKIDNIKSATLSSVRERQEYETKLNDHLIPETTALQRKIDRLESVKEEKLKELNEKNPEIVEAVRWLEQHRSQFNGTIYDPMIFELQISPANAKYLENVVRHRDLMAFVCEDKSDMSALINELCIKRKLQINVIHCEPANRCLYSADIPIHSLKNFGLQAYLVNLVSGPPSLINKLCSSYHIHNIPIGTDAVSNYTSQIPPSIRQYFGGSKKFVSMSSKYRKEAILTEQSIHGWNLVVSVDERELELLKRTQREKTKEKDDYRNLIQQLDSKIQSQRQQMSEESDRKVQLDQKWNKIESARVKLEHMESELLKYKKELAEMRENRKIFESKVVEIFGFIIKLERDLVKLMEVKQRFHCDKEFAHIMQRILTTSSEMDMAALREAEEEHQRALDAFNKSMEEIQIKTRELEIEIQTVRELCNGKLPTDDDFPYSSEFDEMPEMNLYEIDEQINDCAARLECMHVQSDAVAEFEKKTDEYNRLMHSLSSHIEGDKTLETLLSELYSEWEPRLIQLVGKISSKFSEFMETLSLVGEVVLCKKDMYDFESYGMEILVKYRKEAKLQALDKSVQSGGERTVAIAIYSLSLQHITHVPFRCVDEINQGMDPNNERQIYELLLREATKPGSSQYLFVTPKLPRNLNHNPQLNVSIVFNSAVVTAGTTFPIN